MGKSAETQSGFHEQPGPAMPDLSGQFVKSGVRVVRVLEYFHQIDRPARAIEIGRALNLAPSSVSDLLKTLVEVGYLDFDETEKSYFPGLRAALFGQWLAKSYPHVDALDELVHRLSEESGETAVLFAQRFHQVQVLVVGKGSVPPPGNIVEGANLPVFGTAAGGAVLMVKSREEFGRIAQRTFRTKSSGKAVAAMGEIVRDFRSRGYAHSMREDVIPDNWAIALPLPQHFGSSTAVIGIGGPIDRVRGNEGDLARLLRDRVSHAFH